MKKVKEFYVIVSKDKKYFTGTSGSPYKLDSSQISKVQGFKTKEEAEARLKELPDYRRRYIAKYKQNQATQASYGNLRQVELWEYEIKREQKALNAVDGASVKKVILSWEVEE